MVKKIKNTIFKVQQFTYVIKPMNDCFFTIRNIILLTYDDRI